MSPRLSPPKHLRASSQALWKSVTTDFELEPHHMPLLTLALEALDRGAEAREGLAAAGALVIVDDRGNPRPHPLAAIEKDSRIAFARMLRELDLDAVPASSGCRPPSITSSRG